ncbi:MAG: ABC transporter permease [Treponema sp.]|jgi:putative ABC transport system permease protein|nr:ABC transporter permease [Treponema sp.]
MNILLLLNTSFRSILRNRMRSLLTSLGIIIGVGSVIVMMAAGAGAQRSIEERISAMGTNLLQIMPRRIMMRAGQANMGGAFPRPNRLTRADARKLKNESSYAMAISGVSRRNFTAASNSGSWSTTVMGVEENYLPIRNWNIAEGTFFGSEDLEARNRLAVLGASVAENLFGNEDPLGQHIKISSDRFTVIGVLEKKGAGGGTDQDDVILIPLDTALTRLGNSQNLSYIAMSVVSRNYMDAAQEEAGLILREAHKLKDSDTADFEIMNQADVIDMASETSRSLTGLLAAIAGVSLLVGGIGIMNIMLVSVTERTREIGIRMSVGARKADILLQFLSEAVTLSLLGGLAGICLALAACRALEAAGIPAVINPLIALIAALFAAFVGIVFGFYPAQKAARLYPIDALRYE